jgi:hypothetical protein
MLEEADPDYGAVCGKLRADGEAWARTELPRPQQHGPVKWTAKGPTTVGLSWSGFNLGTLELDPQGGSRWLLTYDGPAMAARSETVRAGCPLL